MTVLINFMATRELQMSLRAKLGISSLRVMVSPTPRVLISLKARLIVNSIRSVSLQGFYFGKYGVEVWCLILTSNYSNLQTRYSHLVSFPASHHKNKRSLCTRHIEVVSMLCSAPIQIAGWWSHDQTPTSNLLHVQNNQHSLFFCSPQTIHTLPSLCLQQYGYHTIEYASSTTMYIALTPLFKLKSLHRIEKECIQGPPTTSCERWWVGRHLMSNRTEYASSTHSSVQLGFSRGLLIRTVRYMCLLHMPYMQYLINDAHNIPMR